MSKKYAIFYVITYPPYLFGDRAKDIDIVETNTNKLINLIIVFFFSTGLKYKCNKKKGFNIKKRVLKKILFCFKNN